MKSIAAILAAIMTLQLRGVQSKGQDIITNTSMALNDPDRFSWALFVDICQEAPRELQKTITLPDGQKVQSNNAIWETWADDPFTFPKQPDRDSPPKWADRNGQGKILEPILQLQIRAHNLAAETENGGNPLTVLVETSTNSALEETRRNEASFDFIITNNLFFQEGLAAAFRRAVESNGYPNGMKVSFPLDAIEVKASWTNITEDQKPLFHWNYDNNGKLWGLVALHIMTKALPNWTWATFEWSGNTPDQTNGNPGRSDYHGSYDSFGVIPHFQPPHIGDDGSFILGQQYQSGSLTPELLQLFSDSGYSGEWLTEFENYRLKGSQVNFTDATGQPTYLGNSVTEAGFVQTSSCISCHGTASVDAQGGSHFGSGLGFTTDSDNQSVNGALNPAFFYDITQYDPSREFGTYVLKNYPMDFIWAVFRARPDHKGLFSAN